MSEDIVYRLDAYMKKCILNCVKRFAKRELALKMREVSLDEISEKLNNGETALLSDIDNCAVFVFDENNRKDKKLEEYFSNDEIGQAVEKLSDQEKDIIILSVLCGYTSEQIGKKYNLSASTIRVKLKNAIAKINKNYNGG